MWVVPDGQPCRAPGSQALCETGHRMFGAANCGGGGGARPGRRPAPRPSRGGPRDDHPRASRLDLCFELATQIMERLAGWVTVCDEVQGFRYFDERDLIGFVDGTENPSGAAAADAAIIGDQDPEFAGGSYVIVQKYLHDVRSWNALPIEEQEKVIGRSKLSDIEMADDVKPANSHVALNTIVEPDGTQRQIFRANMPFGAPGHGEFGTYYIGYPATPEGTEQMLVTMFIGRAPCNFEPILEFSSCMNRNPVFVPSAEFLDDIPEPPGASARTLDGSLRIGRLP